MNFFWGLRLVNVGSADLSALLMANNLKIGHPGPELLIDIIAVGLYGFCEAVGAGFVHEHLGFENFDAKSYPAGPHGNVDCCIEDLIQDLVQLNVE